MQLQDSDKLTISVRTLRELIDKGITEELENKYVQSSRWTDSIINTIETSVNFDRDDISVKTEPLKCNPNVNIYGPNWVSESIHTHGKVVTDPKEIERLKQTVGKRLEEILKRNTRPDIKG